VFAFVSPKLTSEGRNEMPSIGSITFTGKSGTQYSFDIYPSETRFAKVGAVYAVTKRTVGLQGKTHARIYVGEADSLRERFENHHRQECFDRHGANCICVHLDDDEESRLAKETDLRNAYDWICNRQ
jgi:hypothetical protein